MTSSRDKFLALRTGVIYTGDGKASITLPAGNYTLYAGRGFEYSVDSITLNLKKGDHAYHTFAVKREVDTKGWICSDTHVHTFTHSHHGDATEEERVITLAGEGIELPIITDHNQYIDLTKAAREKNVLPYFTPVVGDEVTTNVGHFNIFPVDVTSTLIDSNVPNWNTLSEDLKDTSKDKVIMLNHAADIHHNFRPFDSTMHLSSSGIRVDDWRFPANAMEVLNSGSQQSDIMTLYHLWFGMLNGGFDLTPVGSSDSHDVSRYIVGQGRTYVKSDDRDPGKIDVKRAVQNFREGKVMVSAGLLTKMTINDSYGPGEIVPSSKELKVVIEVLGPSWVKADQVSLYSNGRLIRSEKINHSDFSTVKWNREWIIPFPKHDVFLVAIAEGPADGMVYWPIAKPYQPSTIHWKPRLIGSSGAVWIDGDKNRERNCARDYARQLIKRSNSNMSKLIKLLSDYDEAVSIQAAALLWKQEKQFDDALRSMSSAAPQTKTAFQRVSKEVNRIKK